MKVDTEKLDAIYKRTDGQCHICRKRLARKNYGKVGSRGAWEIEHSKPRSKGGTDHGNNLYAACISCNRSKGNSSNYTARSKNGYKAAPYSQVQKKKNAWIGAGAGGGLALLLCPPQIRIPAMIVCAALGGHLGKNSERD